MVNRKNYSGREMANMVIVHYNLMHAVREAQRVSFRDYTEAKSELPEKYLHELERAVEEYNVFVPDKVDRRLDARKALSKLRKQTASKIPLIRTKK